ncbi:unnamed protein product [Vicia faba]|uniref:Uncharacterized protein n=1 Tax=Vicia faba TaxID=3906 RepID=A0AAV0YPH6_VICFA|nr:unnamed protein product [Vicia faba]
MMVLLTNVKALRGNQAIERSDPEGFDSSTLYEEKISLEKRVLEYHGKRALVRASLTTPSNKLECFLRKIGASSEVGGSNVSPDEFRFWESSFYGLRFMYDHLKVDGDIRKALFETSNSLEQGEESLKTQVRGMTEERESQRAMLSSSMERVCAL